MEEQPKATQSAAASTKSTESTESAQSTSTAQPQAAVTSFRTGAVAILAASALI